MDFEKEYDSNFLLEVIKYNHERYISLKNNLPFELNKEYERVLSARYMKCSRIKRRLVYLLSRYKYVWFITFTFNNYYINKSTRTKRDLIKSCISTKDFKFILNIDYGKTTEREHYHCILATNEDIDINDYIKKFYPCYSLSIPCKIGFSDFARLTKYINKLTNHCIKATTKRQRIYYNFKGYDSFLPTYRDRTIAYDLEFMKLFQEC